MKIGIFISGSGTNMLALIDRWRAGAFSAVERIAFVLSDDPTAAGIEKARAADITALVVPREKGESRQRHEQRMLDAIAPFGAELLVLAGFMRVLSPHFLSHFSGRIINIHPSLLPAFPGVDAQRQAFDHGVKVTGCTVHFVDDSLDGGPIILQRAVERRDDDTAEDLRLRILAQEHQMLGEAVDLVTTGSYRLENRYVSVERNHES